ncbi:MAG TPA: helix-turn-helix domain-containing protein [Steroidobacteraceae bacterium]|jgi:excisionase family DNA binding protein|nr:helix-turn-helix domain-containing protein [Steroidobacteraceae bacterium]
MSATTAAIPAPSLLSVEQVAAILALNVRTVRNYVRGGSLKATRIGKQYRIGLVDLETFMGRPVHGPDERQPSRGGRVEISSVINIEGVNAAVAGRITDMLMATADVLRAIGQPVAVSTTYDVQLNRVRVLLAADLKSTRDFLSMINAVLAEPPAASL